MSSVLDSFSTAAWVEDDVDSVFSGPPHMLQKAMTKSSGSKVSSRERESAPFSVLVLTDL